MYGVDDGVFDTCLTIFTLFSILLVFTSFVLGSYIPPYVIDVLRDDPYLISAYVVVDDGVSVYSGYMLVVYDYWVIYVWHELVSDDFLGILIINNDDKYFIINPLNQSVNTYIIKPDNTLIKITTLNPNEKRFVYVGKHNILLTTKIDSESLKIIKPPTLNQKHYELRVIDKINTLLTTT